MWRAGEDVKSLRRLLKACSHTLLRLFQGKRASPLDLDNYRGGSLLNEVSSWLLWRDWDFYRLTSRVDETGWELIQEFIQTLLDYGVPADLRDNDGK
jgi:hypothetical protein